MVRGLKRTCLTAAGLIVTAFSVQGETVVSVTQTSYDADGRPVCTISRMNPASSTTDACLIDAPGSDGYDRLDRILYDADSNIIEAKRGRKTTDAVNEEEIYATYAYSANGKKVMEADANGNVTRLSYDVFDRLKYVMYPSAAITRSSQPCAAIPDSYTGPVGGIGSAGCVNSQPYTTRATPGSGSLINPTPYLGTYNSADFEQYSYDNNNNLTVLRRRNGQTHSYSYDGIGRQWRDMPSQGQIIFTAYDLSGNICDKIFATDNSSMGNDCDARYVNVSSAGIHNTYDKVGRQIKAKDGNGRVLQYGYNEVSSRTSMTFDDGVVQSYLYNTGQMLTWNGINGTTLGVTPGYDFRGRQTSIARPNGTLTTLQYDDLDRVSQMQHDLGGPSTTYDVTWGFSYNALSLLRNTSSDNTRYDYIQTSATGASPTYDGLNRDSALVGNTAACPIGGYDVLGNLICDGSRTYTYDMDNQLLTAVTTGVSGSNITLTYDPLGRLSSYVKGGLTWQFQYDGPNLVAEYLNGALDKRYLHSVGVDRPFLQFSGSGTAASSAGWLYANVQGSIVAVANNSGATTEFYTYDPWGRPFNEAGALTFSGTRFRYTGQTVLPDANLYYYKARVYDPGYGRFLQTDPVGSKDDLNLYSYVAGDPINNVDPFGLSRLVFDPVNHLLYVIDKDGNVVGTYTAYNNAQRVSAGAYKEGTYAYSYYKAHPESDKNGSYGSNGIFVFNRDDCAGCGVHAGQEEKEDQLGRKGPQHATKGCIRTTDEATAKIKELAENDPLTSLTVKKDYDPKTDTTDKKPDTDPKEEPKKSEGDDGKDKPFLDDPLGFLTSLFNFPQ